MWDALKEMSKTVLVVEDDEMLMELLCRSLHKYGFETIQASDGEEALERFTSASERPLAVVTDYFMPRMNGGELAQRILELDPAFPIVLVTGELPSMLPEELICLKNIATVAKPFLAETLAKALRSVLQSKL